MPITPPNSTRRKTTWSWNRDIKTLSMDKQMHSESESFQTHQDWEDLTHVLWSRNTAHARAGPRNTHCWPGHGKQSPAACRGCSPEGRGLRRAATARLRGLKKCLLQAAELMVKNIKTSLYTVGGGRVTVGAERTSSWTPKLPEEACVSTSPWRGPEEHGRPPVRALRAGPQSRILRG